MARLPQVRPGDVPSVQMSSGAGDALVRTGQAFFKLSQQALGQAENAAVTRAEEQGAVLGATGELQLRDPKNRADAAFNTAMRGTFSNDLSTRMSGKADELEQTYRNDPVGFERTFSAWYKGIRPASDPRMATAADAEFQTHLMAGAARGRRVHFAESQDRQAASIFEAERTMNRTIERNAASLFSGDQDEAQAAMSAIAMELGKIDSLVAQTGPNGRLFFSAEEAARLQAKALENVIFSGLKGWVDAQPSKIAARETLKAGAVQAVVQNGDDDSTLGTLLSMDPREQLDPALYDQLINYADSLVGPEQERFKSLMRDERVSRRTTGQSLGLFGEEEARLVFGEGADDFLRSLDAETETYRLTQRLVLATPAEELAIITALAPAGEGFADEFDRQQMAIRVVQEKGEQLASDSATFVSRNSPGVQQAFDRVDTGEVPLNEAIRASLRQQQKLGVLPGLDRVLTNARAAEIAQRFAVDDVGEAADLIEGLAEQYGPYWPKVHGELAEAGLPPPAIVLGKLYRPGQVFARRALVDALRTGQKDLATAIGKDAVTTIEDSVDGFLADYNDTLDFAQQGSTIYAQSRDAVRLIAMQYARTRDATASVQLAANEVVNNLYEFVKGGQSSYRVPTSVPVGKVRVKAHNIMESLEDEDIQPLGSLDPQIQAMPEHRVKSLIESTREFGKWVSNPDDTGLILLDPVGLPMLRMDGSIVGFTWDEVDYLRMLAPASAGTVAKEEGSVLSIRTGRAPRPGFARPQRGAR